MAPAKQAAPDGGEKLQSSESEITEAGTPLSRSVAFRRLEPGVAADPRRAGLLAGRRRWLLLAAAVLVPLLIVLGSWAATNDADPVPELLPAASFPGVPAAVKDANQAALGARAARRKAAERKAFVAKRKREAAAPTAVPVSTVDEAPSSELPSQPPPPPPSAPSAGKESSAPASPPDIQHGIGNGG